MKWRRVRTHETGWRRDVLVYRGHIVGAVDTFSYAAYGNVLGERTGAIKCRRKAMRVVRRRVQSESNTGLMRFIGADS